MSSQLTCDTVQQNEMVEAYLFDRLSEDERERFEAHYLTCDRCQVEIRKALQLRSAFQAAAAVGSDSAGSPVDAKVRRWHPAVKIGSLLAAATLAGLLLLRPGGLDMSEDPAHRAADVDTQTVTPLTPDGPVPGVEGFHWSVLPGVERYRVTLFDEGGNVLFEEVVTDSVLLVPPNVRLDQGTAYLWKVEAEVGFDRWLSSDLITFSISEE